MAHLKKSRIEWVDLGPDVLQNLTWSNDPEDLLLEIYFDADKVPNLPEDYSIDGLEPILADRDGETFILTDSQWRYYCWNRMAGELFILRGVDTGKQHLQTAMWTVMRELAVMRMDPVCTTDYGNGSLGGAR